MKAVRVYHASLHFGEEPFVRGNERAGMVNFAGCHLACTHCYTPEAASGRHGEDQDADVFFATLEGLVHQGARNLNFVSPTVAWPRIEPVLRRFRAAWPGVPVVLKPSGYEGAGFLERMAALADVVVPDFKVSSEAAARAVGLPPAYGVVARRGIETLVKTHGEPRFGAEGCLERGLVVRYLVMPGFDDDGREVVDALGRARYRGALNVMTRFVTPGGRLVRAKTELVEDLAERARAYGMAVAVDGSLRREEEMRHAIGR